MRRDVRDGRPDSPEPVGQIGPVAAVKRGLPILDVDLSAKAISFAPCSHSAPTGGDLAGIASMGGMKGFLRSTGFTRDQPGSKNKVAI
jgi:hypothetical protein